MIISLDTFTMSIVSMKAKGLIMGIKPTDNRNIIFTIGHSNHSPERFLELLHGEAIDVFVDVRSHPYSKHVPHFDRSQLEKYYTSNGIRYLFMGEELGGKPIEVFHIRGDGTTQTETELKAAETGGQLSLFEAQEDKAWKSTRSVLPRKQRNNSSRY